MSAAVDYLPNGGVFQRFYNGALGNQSGSSNFHFLTTYQDGQVSQTLTNLTSGLSFSSGNVAISGFKLSDISQLALFGVTTTGASGSFDNVVISTTKTVVAPPLSAPPSLYDLSRFSEIAYGNAVAQPGWHELSIQPAGFAVGFQAKAVATSSGDRVVIAFAGTNELADWLGPNPSFISPSGPTQEMRKFVQDAVEFVRSAHSLYPNASIEFTGHSLGGALAQLMADRLGVSATTFNAPGSAGMRTALETALLPLDAVRQSLVNREQGLGSAIVNYRNYGDLVSTIGSQIGTERTFEPIPNSSSLVDFKTLVDQFPLTTAKAMHLLELIQERILSSAKTDFARGPTAASIAVDEAKGLLKTALLKASRNFYELVIRASVFAIVNYVVDPSSFDAYKIMGTASSPRFKTFTAPFLALGDYDFALEAEIEGVWRSFGIIGELDTVIFDGDGATGIAFRVLNKGTQIPASEIEEFQFGFTFTNDGFFDGSLVASDSRTVPVPGTLLLLSTALLLLAVARRRRQLIRVQARASEGLSSSLPPSLRFRGRIGLISENIIHRLAATPLQSNGHLRSSRFAALPEATALPRVWRPPV